MTLPGQHFTYDDYLRLPEDKRYELVERESICDPLGGVHGDPDLAVTEVFEP